MSTVTKPRVRVKPARKVRLCQAPTVDSPGIVDITMGTAMTSYFIVPIPADFGRAFRLEKFSTHGGGTYDVCIDGPRSTCCCKGASRHGHCKHIDGLSALLKVGKLS